MFPVGSNVLCNAIVKVVFTVGSSVSCNASVKVLIVFLGVEKFLASVESVVVGDVDHALPVLTPEDGFLELICR